MKLHVSSLTLIAAIALGSPFTGMAASKKKADAMPSPAPAATATAAATASPEKKETKADRSYRYKGTILAVDRAAKTFSIQGKETTRVFKITDKTKLTKDDAPAIWDDIKVGELVRVSGKKTGEGNL